MFSKSLEFIMNGLMIFSSIFFLLLAIRFVRQKKYLRELRYVRLLPDGSIQWPKVSIIIPVCNEVNTVKAAAISLFSMDYPNLEFIFVNDRSSDGTEVVLEQLQIIESRMKVVNINSLPQGWLGKLNAFQRGIEASTGTWLLFSDADVHYNKQALKKAITHSHQNNLDFLGVIPSVVSPSIITRILLGQILHYYVFFTNYRKISDPNSNAAAAHGAFMLVKRDSYFKSRGFEWLKMEVMDDIGFATEMKISGAKIDTLHGIDEIEFEWYSSVKKVIKGFEKNLFAAMQFSYFNVISVILLFTLTFLSYSIFPFFTKNWSLALILWGSILIYIISASRILKKLIDVPLYSPLIFPLTFLFFPFLVVRSSLSCLKNNGLFWRGTFYSAKDLKQGQRLKLLKNTRNSD